MLMILAIKRLVKAYINPHTWSAPQSYEWACESNVAGVTAIDCLADPESLGRLKSQNRNVIRLCDKNSA
jgi:hypothetical protein